MDRDFIGVSLGRTAAPFSFRTKQEVPSFHYQQYTDSNSCQPQHNKLIKLSRSTVQFHPLESTPHHLCHLKQIKGYPIYFSYLNIL